MWWRSALVPFICFCLVLLGASACTSRGDSETCSTDADCDDGNPCSVDRCQGGVCANDPGGVTCDDSNACTDDACDPGSGCQHTDNDAPCDDGDPCTPNDRCQSGLCYGGQSTCACTGDADCARHDDENPCNGTLHCVQGFCEIDPDTVVTCDGSSDTACARSVCDPALGSCRLIPRPDGEPCDDGDPCTQADQCQAGICYGGGGVCDCQSDADCASREDGNLCNGTLLCVDGLCEIDPATVVRCDTSGDTGCRRNTCDPSDGVCKHESSPDGQPCNDLNACTQGDSCQAGVCAGTELPCSDGDVCTDDVCEPHAGCVFPYNAEPCDDGDPGTPGDTCIQGFCVGDPDAYGNLDHLEEGALRQALLGRVSGHDALSYDGARVEMYSDIDNQGGRVQCVYTGEWVTTSGIPDGSDMNTEHTWCRSWGADTLPALSDLHHLFPVVPESNSVRSYHRFGEVVTVEWSQGGSSKGLDADGYTVFEPRDAHKGDAARAMFYFAVRYEMEIFYHQEQALKAWNASDPPDAKERMRNDSIEAVQGKRNPFIDRPDFVGRISDF